MLGTHQSTQSWPAQPVDDGALETYDAHNAVDDCRALLKLMKAIDEYLGSSCL